MQVSINVLISISRSVPLKAYNLQSVSNWVTWVRLQNFSLHLSRVSMEQIEMPKTVNVFKMKLNYIELD